MEGCEFRWWKTLSKHKIWYFLFLISFKIFIDSIKWENDNDSIKGNPYRKTWKLTCFEISKEVIFVYKNVYNIMIETI